MEVKIPAVGESITEVTLAEWKKKDGDYVQINDVLVMVETDKATVELAAEKPGILKIKTPAGTVVPVGSIVADIDTSAAPQAAPAKPAAAEAPQASTAPAAKAAPAAASSAVMPAAQRLASEKGIDASGVSGTGRGGRVLKEDVQKVVDGGGQAKSAPAPSMPAQAPVAKAPRTDKGQRIVPMTTIRKRIAQRLVEAKTQAAILTTFNEIDMTAYNRLKDSYGEKFKEKYGVRLGFLGLFAKACVEGLKAFPAVNAFVDGDNIIYNDYYNFGIAVSTEKGLVVPVVRDVDELSLAEIEHEIKRLAVAARDGKLGIDDMRGGTFTISNGGVFGSLMSTPILNPPQSGILGLHKVEDRPMAINGKVEIRPMMYIALSYDHRIVDGKESVSFLVRVKECMEDPERVLIGI